MPVKCRDIIKLMENLAHPKHRESWDNIGLQIGDSNALIEKIMVTLDVNLDVVKEAVNLGVDMLIVHHTPMFNPLKTIRWDKPQGKIIEMLIKNNINLYCAHTNLDSAFGGVNDVLAKKLDLQNLEVLAPSWEEKFFKVVVFVPKGYENQVRQAMTESGAGFIGNYSDCTYQIYGTGTFRPLEGTNPFIGEKGKLEKAEEYRIETIVPEDKVESVLREMIAAHPYEEVAYDIYPLANKGKVTGLGRIGVLSEETTLLDLIIKVKEVLNIKSLRYVGELDSKISKVALCGGSGASLIKHALKHNAHVFITGDLKYHEAQDALSMGLNLIDAGHYATEFPVIQVVAEFLAQNFVGQGIKVFVSQINTDPFRFI